MTDKQSEFTLFIDSQSAQKEYFKDLYRYRELLFFLTWRDIIVRYKQALLGVAWVIIRPLLTMAVFAFIFGKLAGLSSHGVNYSLFVLAALIPWLLFASTLTDAGFCLLNNTHLISKMYFPRIILIISNILVNFLDFLIGLGVTLILMLFAGYKIGWSVLLLPLFTAQLLMLCLSVGLWLSAFTVKFRDLRFLVQFMVQFGMFVSPIGYDSSSVPSHWRWLYNMNPIVGVIDGFRWALFGVYSADFWLSQCFTIASISILIFWGFSYFRRTERIIADVI